MSQRLKELKAKREQLKKDMLEESKKVFKEESKALFEDNPSLKQFGWIQYTPYFNDGDTCEFSAHTEYPTVNYYSSDYGDYQIDEDEAKKLLGVKELPEDVDEKLEKKVVEFLSVFNEEDLKEMYGDHCTVSVTKKGVEVEEYEHD